MNLNDTMNPEIGEYDEGRRIPLTGIDAARAVERDLFDEGKRRSGLTDSENSRQSKALMTAVAQQDARNRERFGEQNSARIVKPGRLPQGEAMWAMAAEQAKARDIAHGERQERLFGKIEQQKGVGDFQAAGVTRLQAEFEAKRYERDVWSDCVSKELAIRPNTQSEAVTELIGHRDEAYRQERDLEARWAKGQDLLDRREGHLQRQEAYRDLAAFAGEKGATRAANFLERYGEFKQAQYGARLAETIDDPKRIEATKAELAKAREIAIEAKGELKIREVSALAGAFRARLDNPRLFTKPEAPKVAEAEKAEQARSPIERRPSRGVEQRVDAGRAQIAAQGGGKVEPKLGPLARKSLETEQRADQLRQTGATNPEFVRLASRDRATFESVMSRTEAGRTQLAGNAERKAQAQDQRKELSR